MAGENVIRKDVVQIGFDVIGNPIKEIQSMVNNLTGGAKKAMQGVDGITKEAKAAADSVKDIGESAKQASNTAKNMSEPIKKTAESAKDASKSLESMAKSIDKAGTGKIKSIPTAIKSSATAAKQFAASLKANIADGATKGFQKLKNTVQSVKNIKLSDLTSGLLRGVNNLKDKFSGAAKAAKEIEDNMDGAKSSIDDATDEAGKLGSKLKSVASAFTKALGGLTLAAGAGAIGLGTAVVKSFGELEQNIGGAESVFQDLGKTINDMSAKTMVLDKKTKELTETTTSLGKLSENAYKTMGISQSEYLATANKMGALFQGSGLDQQRALDLTTQAMQRAADMASVMGIDQASALESVAGAAKGNYTMMDNLGVAMNETTLSAYALSQGMTKAWKDMSNAEKAETAMQYFFERTSQYASNFEHEATGTVSGAFGLLKASAQSFVAGLGSADADIEHLTSNIVDAFQAVMKNVTPVLNTLVSALPKAAKALVNSLGSVLPTLLKSFTELFSEVLKSLLDLIPQLIPAFSDTLVSIGKTIINSIPNIITCGIELVDGLINGVADALPDLIPTFVNGVLKAIDRLVSNIPKFVNSGVKLIQGLIKGISQAIPQIIKQAPIIINNLASGISQSLNMLLSSGGDMITSLINGISNSIPMILNVATDIITGLADGITNNLPSILDKGLEVIMNLVAGITQNLPKIADAALNCIDKLASGLSDNLPKILDAGAKALESLVQGIMDNLPSIINTAMEIITRLIQTIVENLPQILQTGADLLLSLVQGIVEALPDLLNTAVQLLLYLVNTIVENLPMLIQTGIQLVISLIEGIVNALPDIVTAAVDAIMAFVRGIADNLPMIIQTGIEMMTELYMGIWECIPDIIEAGFGIIGAIIEGIFSGDLLSIGWDIVTGIVKGIFNGLISAASKIWDWITSIFTGGSVEDEMGEIKDAGKATANSFVIGVKSENGDLAKAANGMKDTLTNGVNASNDMYRLGSATGNSFSEGIESSTYNVNAAAYGMGYSATSSLMFATSAAKDAGSEMCSQFGEGMLVHIGNTTYSAASLAQAAKDGVTSINGYDIGSAFGQDFSSGIAAEDVTIEVDTENTKAALDTLSVDFNDTLANIDSETMSKFSGIKTTMSSMIQSACNSVIGTMTDMVSQLSGISLFATGQNLMLGLYDGIVSMRDALINTAQSIATSISSTINNALEIHSPSRVMFRTGQFVDMGVIEGMRDVMPDVAQTSMQLGETITGSTTTGIDTSYDNAPVSNYGGNTSTNNYSPSFTLNFTSNGGGESEQTVKKWIKDAMAEVFNNLETENAPIWEI